MKTTKTMYKPAKQSPDRVILFEVGIIVSLIFVLLILEIKYKNPPIFTQSDNDPEIDVIEVTYVASPELDQPKLEEQPKAVIQKASIFNPISTIKFVLDNTDLFKADEKIQTKAPVQFIKPIEIKKQSKPSNEIVIIPDVFPEFPGGENARQNHIADEFKFNNDMFYVGGEFNVVVQFVISKDGQISDIKILTCSLKGIGVEEEAIRLFKAMPKWTPAKVQGQPVNCRMIQPIKLKVD